MNRQPSAPGPDGGGRELASVLGDLRQRWVLSILLDRSRPISVTELGRQLVASEDGVLPSDLSESDIQSVVVDLEHRCLPRLEAMGLIERGHEGVVAVQPLPVETALSLPAFDEPEDPDWKPVSVLVARPIRQDVVSLLAGQDQRLTVDDLATELQIQTQHDQAAYPRNIQQLQTRFHHVTLPKLAAVDLVAYDPANHTTGRTERTVAIARRTGLDTTADGVPSN